MKLCFVTPSIGDDFENWKKLIEQVVAGGVDMIQIRDKMSPKHRILEAAKAVQPLLKRGNVALIINDHIEIALAVNAQGVHLGQSDGCVNEARSALGHSATIGLSVENLEQALAATQLNVNYLAASPLFCSKTKLDCGKPWGISGLKQLCTVAQHPIFAIGGIDLNNLDKVACCGVSGVAIVSAIANSVCPKSATQALIMKLRGG